MKNLKNNTKLELLPFRESRNAYLTRIYSNMWNLDKFDHTWIRSEKTDCYWTKIDHTIKRYIGKSFDRAFRNYCSKVELFEQEYFLNEFEKQYRYDGGYVNYCRYIVDENGNIQYNPNKRKPKPTKSITFYSFDYKILGDNITGFSKFFEDKNDKGYLRLRAEDRKRQNLLYKRNKNIRKEYGFKRKTPKYIIEANGNMYITKNKYRNILTYDIKKIRLFNTWSGAFDFYKALLSENKIPIETQCTVKSLICLEKIIN